MTNTENNSSTRRPVTSRPRVPATGIRTRGRRHRRRRPTLLPSTGRFKWPSPYCSPFVHHLGQFGRGVCFDSTAKNIRCINKFRRKRKSFLLTTLPSYFLHWHISEKKIMAKDGDVWLHRYQMRGSSGTDGFPFRIQQQH